MVTALKDGLTKTPRSGEGSEHIVLGDLGKIRQVGDISVGVPSLILQVLVGDLLVAQVLSRC